MEHNLVRHAGVMMLRYRNACLLRSGPYEKEFLFVVRIKKYINTIYTM